MPFWLTCNVIVDKGLSVEYKSPSIDILDFGKSWTVTATAKVPLFVWLAKKFIVQVSCNITDNAFYKSCSALI